MTNSPSFGAFATAADRKGDFTYPTAEQDHPSFLRRVQAGPTDWRPRGDPPSFIVSVGIDLLRCPSICCLKQWLPCILIACGLSSRRFLRPRIPQSRQGELGGCTSIFTKRAARRNAPFSLFYASPTEMGLRLANGLLLGKLGDLLLQPVWLAQILKVECRCE